MQIPRSVHQDDPTGNLCIDGDVREYYLSNNEDNRVTSLSHKQCPQGRNDVERAPRTRVVTENSTERDVNRRV